MLQKPFQSPTFRSFLDNIGKGRLVAQLRRGELALILLSFACGTIAGLAVALISFSSRLLHAVVFGVEGSLSGSAIEGPLVVIGPVIGGMLMGAIALALARWRKKPMRDPIEANALYGGRLSLTDSLIVCVQNVISNGFGASVGLEAGYTQVASAIASKIGSIIKLRRGDMRILVGCGAAGAISAAFDAPLTAAFYAIELIIGTYTVMTLAPVVVSALAAKLVIDAIGAKGLTITLGEIGALTQSDYGPAILLGLVSAGLGILLMQGVSSVEMLARKSRIPAAVRPIIGGLLVGLLALLSPQVLSGGHGALHINMEASASLAALAGLLAMKAAASAISLGSGFRGGLFFASLLMGALVGKIFAILLGAIDPAALLPQQIYAVIGMSAFAAAVIGGPLAMTFLALEMTGDFQITLLVLAAVIATSLTVRVVFGYSFATWRFHLRGETIRSAHDVGWVRDLTVDRLMRADVRTASRDLSLDAFRSQFPLGSTQRVVMVDGDGRYCGLILVPDVYADPIDRPDADPSLDRFLIHTDDMLLASMNIKEATAIFERTQSEALAVVDTRTTRRPIGLLTESHTLRRYSEELDQHRREVSGEI
ncbi:chloride channel protein, CIC family [Rhizobium sp. RU20A]|uniref:chloride channel protein n=1 Tax=Rhizobium sp. RU20A TaxID=1907412 RepID=UPI0009551881|nr:chloride channel protein [Rhizobium sp. RU20A]SIQ08588.1 chloride channel protein, CIC family [Rhizobium sp. RU20A]